jgi:hypothetical protein
MQVTFTIVRTGDEIAGAWTTGEGASGTIVAQVTGNQLLGLRAKQLNPCVGEFVGLALIEDDGRKLLGAYEGDGCGMPVKAEFAVIKTVGSLR